MAALAVTLLATLLPPQGAHGLIDLTAGSCVFTPLQATNVSYQPAMRALPGSPSITVSGTGTCVSDFGVGTLSFLGLLTGQAWSCAEGVALGVGAFSFSFPGFSRTFDPVTLTLVNGGGTLSLSFVQGISFAGSAVAVQDPVAMALCPVAGVASTTWTGDLSYEDPEISDG